MRTSSLVAFVSLALLLGGCKSDADKYADDLVSKMKEFAAVLESIKDPASSRDGAVKIKKITSDLMALAQKAPSIRGTQAEGERIKKRMETEMTPVNATIMREAKRIEGNPALLTPELTDAMQGLGSAGVTFSNMAKNAR